MRGTQKYLPDTNAKKISLKLFNMRVEAWEVS